MKREAGYEAGQDVKGEMGRRERMLLLLRETNRAERKMFQIKIRIGDKKSVRCHHTKIPQCPEVWFPNTHGRTRYQSPISYADPPAAAIFPLHMSLRNHMDIEPS